MNSQKARLLIVALLLIGGTALGIRHWKTHQRLGAPGIKTEKIANSQRLDIYLPEKVLGYNSELVPTDPQVMQGLPQDTSYMQRRYTQTNEPTVLLNVVLMGTDRTSIHKPQFCLTGMGWNIDSAASVQEKIPIQSPRAYDLPVMKLISSREVKDHEQIVRLRGIFVYWFVADHDLTADHWARIGKSTYHLLTKGELERWAYVACFCVCLPEQEDETYARMKKFIAASVPQFQLSPGQAMAATGATRTASN